MAVASLGKLHNCLLILSLCSATRYQAEARDNFQHYIADNHNVERRQATQIALKGIIAWNKLLKGTAPRKTNSKKYDLYEKTGTFENAMDDFYSVSPQHIMFAQDRSPHLTRRTYQGRIVTGWVGDKMLRVVENGGLYGRYGPTLDIIGEQTPDAPYIAKIIYKSIDD